MEKKINVVVVGTGFGNIVHIPAYKMNEKYNLIGIYGKNIDKVKDIAEKNNIKAYQSIEEIADDENVHLVSIASIPIEHYQMAKKFMISGKDIILEKPMAMNKQESEELLKISEERGCKTSIVHEHRFDSSKAYAKYLLSNGLFGKIRSIEIIKHMTYWNSCYGGRNYDWFAQKELGGGMIGAHLSHQLDFINYICNSPFRNVIGSGFVEVRQRYDRQSQKLKDHTSDDSVLMIGETENGVNISVNISASKYRTINTIKIFTSCGEILIEGQNQIKIFDQNGELKTESIPQEFRIKDYGVDFRLNSFMCLIDDFYENYYCGISKEITTFKDGHEIQKILDTIISAR